MIAYCEPTTERLTDDDHDVALMLRVGRDDAGAFAALVRRHWDRAYRWFLTRLGDRQEAEDLTQELFLRLYRGRKRYRREARFATWLHHIARNVLRNALRTRQRKPSTVISALEPKEGTGAVMVLSDRASQPSQPLERREIATKVRRAVAKLRERQRQAVVLFDLEDRSHADVAMRLGVTPQAAKSLLYRARAELRAALEPIVQA